MDGLLKELNSSGLGLNYGNGADENISCLAYADDLVLISSTEAKLQQLVNLLRNYCSKWRLTVNTSKTKMMVFRRHHMCR